MKRVLQILFGYIVFCFCVCLAVGFFSGTLPELLAKSVYTYRLYAGLRFFCRILPAVTITGVIIGFAVSYGRHPEGSVMRFSSAMLGRYRYVIITGIICSFILTCTEEIGTPVLVSKQLQLVQMPKLAREYVRIGTKEFISGNSDLAFQYAKRAAKFDPKSDSVQQLLNKTEIAIKTSRQNRLETVVPEISQGVSEEGYTVSQLRKLAEKSFSAGNWFDAHYYAETGISVASPKDTNIELLRRIAAAAWNELSRAEKIPETEAERVYKLKLDGYKLLMAGDNMKAYYVFKKLSMQSRALSIDPDIVRYLKLANVRLAAESFFIDETFNLQEFETADNIYFKIQHADGSTDIVYIKGITSIKGTDSMVQYLRGFSVVSLDKNGINIRRMYVPYAKLLAVPVSDFDDDTRTLLGIDKKTEYVPYILLRSIDRSTEGIVSEPLYWYESNTAEIEKDQLILPVSYTDFELLVEASKGAEFMSIPALIQFVGKTVQYGYSEEVFGQVMLNRILYPLFIFIIIVCSAIFAWNYRISEKLMFKTVWVSAFPLLSILLYILFTGLLWLYKLFNYVFLGTAGRKYALLAACGVYAAILIISSIMFLSRNAADAA
ncbi:MAG: hypothetical protein M0P01_02665 [Treponema sp.]|nr:hypothetical protein [Treponema sp.]